MNTYLQISTPVSNTKALVRVSRQLRSLLECRIVSHSMPQIFSLLQWKTRVALVHWCPEFSFVMSFLHCPWASWVGRMKCVLTPPNADSRLFITCLLVPPLHKHPPIAHCTSSLAFHFRKKGEEHSAGFPRPSSLS